jgi:hypothetical protein
MYNAPAIFQLGDPVKDFVFLFNCLLTNKLGKIPSFVLYQK